MAIDVPPSVQMSRDDFVINDKTITEFVKSETQEKLKEDLEKVKEEIEAVK